MRAMRNSGPLLSEWTDEERRSLTLLLTDIIDSTKIASHQGDDEWIDNVLIPHFDRARELREKYDGCEIKLIGDAYMCVFKTPDAALRFAEELIANTGKDELFIRIAIHVGRVRIHENDIYGLMANYTARLINTIDKAPINPRLAAKMDRSRIAISETARPDIISAFGEKITSCFVPYSADLRGFGTKTAYL
jgi:class 3 adenylate cyclase